MKLIRGKQVQGDSINMLTSKQCSHTELISASQTFFNGLRYIFSVMLIFISINYLSAQFNDFLNYPVTVTPHESPDSTRGHFWGYMFGSYYTKLHADSSKLGYTQYSQIPKGANAFSLERIYLGYDYFFDKHFSVHAVIAHEENADDFYTSKITVDQNNNRTFYLKYANMEWNNIFPGSRLSLGIITTPSFAITEEPFWGYRSIDRTLMDMKANVTGAADVGVYSNDMGVNLGGKVWRMADATGVEDACIGYNIMVGNSTGAIPDNYAIGNIYTVWKRYYGDLYVKVLHDRVVLDLYGDGHTFQWTPYHSWVTNGRIFLGYKTKEFNISALYFREMQYNFVYEPSEAVAKASPIPAGGDTIFNNTQEGISIMAAAVLFRDKKTHNPRWSVFARYDYFNPDVNFNPSAIYSTLIVSSLQYNVTNSATEKYFIVGVDFQPIKQIHFMPNLWYDGILNRDNNLTAIERFDYDFVARVTFYYQFFKN